MTRIEIVTQLLAAHISSDITALNELSNEDIKSVEALADTIIARQAEWYEINTPKPTGRMG